MYRAGKKRLFTCAPLALSGFLTMFTAGQTAPPSENEKPVENHRAKPAAAQGNQNSGDQSIIVAPAYELLRDEEDYSRLQNSAPERGNKNFYDSIKYIPLRRRENWYVSIGGEVRTFYERFDNDAFGAQPADHNGYLLQRLMLHTDWHFGNRVRAFGQIKSGLQAGRRGGARGGLDEDQLDVLQAFTDITFKGKRSGGVNLSASRDTNKDGDSLVLRVGRQELYYGAGRLVSVLEGPNVRFAYDGARLMARFEKWRVDAFAVKPELTGQSVLDNPTDGSRTFWGVYAVRELPTMKTANLDLYYLGLDRQQAQFDGGAGRDARHTFGARLAQSLGKQFFDYDLEFVAQTGNLTLPNRRKLDIQAFAVSGAGGYTFQQAHFAPRVGVDFGYNTGDKNPNDNKIQTFYPLFPRGSYFGFAGTNGALNNIGFNPNLTLQITKQIRVNAGNYWFWRASSRDGFYAPGGGLIFSGQNTRARYIGAHPTFEFFCQIERHTSFTVRAERFYAGRFLRKASPGKDLTYFAAWLTYKF